MNFAVEYVWLGGYDKNYTFTQPRYIKPYTIRSKTRILTAEKTSLNLEDIPVWNYDGSSTNQAKTDKSEVFICPRKLFNNPFNSDMASYLVLCDTYVDLECTKPHKTNTRAKANEIFNMKKEEEPWFGIEQEFFLMSVHDGLPIGFDQLIPQGQFYCSVGSKNAFGREVIERIVKCAFDAGIKLSGWNAEVAPGQWEIQVGILTGIDAADHLWMLRYIMERVTEDTAYYIELHPKPIVIKHEPVTLEWELPDEWNGSGAHTNFSTKSMRNAGGIGAINQAIEKLATNHKKHIMSYGIGNELRLTGRCETSSMDKFSFGIADRKASVRIPTETIHNNCGYIEDRRPSSLMDPYLVTSLLFSTICL